MGLQARSTISVHDMHDRVDRSRRGVGRTRSRLGAPSIDRRDPVRRSHSRSCGRPRADGAGPRRRARRTCGYGRSPSVRQAVSQPHRWCVSSADADRRSDPRARRSDPAGVPRDLPIAARISRRGGVRDVAAPHRLQRRLSLPAQTASHSAGRRCPTSCRQRRAVSGSSRRGDEQGLARALAYLSALKPKKRIAYVLRVVEGMSLDEIGALVGANAPAVGQRVKHAQRELEAMVERDRHRTMETP